ncbi:radical SAM protein [Methanobrevibacter filiformis]|uniref:Biotin synthase n=1 Tax=Methanobrevibacter filiformis TaxID=55758 RepID=A0A165Z4G9_9EURY|nr:radical SAM protein [Methanobrevibacter filiformis]KZX10236.1 biotin synthase [Methanobrevibacter filiformis]
MKNINIIDKIKTNEILPLIAKADKITTKNHGNTITLERAIFLSWWCSKGDCSFCYMSTQKNKIKDPLKARRKVDGIIAEAEMCDRLGWNIEFLSGGYESFKTAEIKSIAENIYEITKKPVWLNIGITDDLDSYSNEIIGITGAIETINPEFHKTVCPSKPIDDITSMLHNAEDLGFKKAITIILGLGESVDDIEYLIDYIQINKIDRIIFYSLNPHKGTIYENSSQPSSLYYSSVVSTIRITNPKIEIICGTWEDNLGNLGTLILSGANGITKFPLFKMFGTKYGKRVEEEVKWTGRQLQGTFTDTTKLGDPTSKFNNKLNIFIKRYIDESLKDKFKK